MSHLQQSTFEVDKSEGSLVSLWNELSALGVFVRNDRGKAITITCGADIFRSARELIEKHNYPQNVTEDATGGDDGGLPNYDEDSPEVPVRDEVTEDAGSDDSPEAITLEVPAESADTEEKPRRRARRNQPTEEVAKTETA